MGLFFFGWHCLLVANHEDVFAILALRGEFDAQATMQVVTMVIAFYFGTQHEKKDPGGDAPKD